MSADDETPYRDHCAPVFDRRREFRNGYAERLPNEKRRRTDERKDGRRSSTAEFP